MGRRLSEPTDELGKDATAKATRWSWTGQGCHGLSWDMNTVQPVGTWWDGCALLRWIDMVCMSLLPERHVALISRTSGDLELMLHTIRVGKGARRNRLLHRRAACPRKMKICLHTVGWSEVGLRSCAWGCGATLGKTLLEAKIKDGLVSFHTEGPVG